MVSVCVWHFDFYKLPKSKLTNAIILCLVRFSSGRNRSAQLLIRARNIFGWTIRTLNITTCVCYRFWHKCNASAQHRYSELWYYQRSVLLSTVLVTLLEFFSSWLPRWCGLFCWTVCRKVYF